MNPSATRAAAAAAAAAATAAAAAAPTAAEGQTSPRAAKTSVVGGTLRSAKRAATRLRLQPRPRGDSQRSQSVPRAAGRDSGLDEESFFSASPSMAHSHSAHDEMARLYSLGLGLGLGLGGGGGFGLGSGLGLGS